MVLFSLKITAEERHFTRHSAFKFFSCLKYLIWYCYFIVKSFHATGLSLHPLKTSENLCFSIFFRGCKKFFLCCIDYSILLAASFILIKPSPFWVMLLTSMTFCWYYSDYYFLSAAFNFYQYYLAFIFNAAFLFSFFLPLLWFLYVITFVVLLTLLILLLTLLTWQYCWYCYCFPDLVDISWYCCCFPNIADISWYWRHFLMQRMFSGIIDIFVAFQMLLVSMLLVFSLRFVVLLLYVLALFLLFLLLSIDYKYWLYCVWSNTDVTRNWGLIRIYCYKKLYLTIFEIPVAICSPKLKF